MARASDSEPTTADLQAELVALKKDIASLGATLGEYGKARGEEFAHAASERAQYLRARGEEGVAHARDSATKAYRQAEDSVRENPATAVGIAAALGFLVGLFASRR